MSDFERIYLEPDHNQIEGRMWCQDDDPASLGEPWTEYVRADLYAEQEDQLFKTMDLVTVLTADRDEWVTKAGKATALASQYLRERDALREALEEVEPWMVAFLRSEPGTDEYDAYLTSHPGQPPCTEEDDRTLEALIATALQAILDALTTESEE
jgi:hypothetical protein